MLQNQHNRTHQKRREKALLSAKELKRIAGVILRDLERKLAQNKEKYEKECELFSRVLLQKQKGVTKFNSKKRRSKTQKYLPKTFIMLVTKST